MTRNKQEPDLLDQIEDAVESAAESIGEFFSSMPLIKPRKVNPGASPGMDDRVLEQMSTQPQDDKPVVITVYDYCKDWARHHTIDNIDEYLASHRPEGTKVRWVNVNGLSDPNVVRQLARKYGLHPLAIEDVFNVPQRAKVEPYPAEGEFHSWVFIVLHMIQFDKGAMQTEQLSIFLGRGTVLVFQERQDGDVFDPVRQRIYKDGSRLREFNVSYLVYAILDAVVDHCFPVLEQYSERLEDLEAQVMAGAKPTIVNDIYRIKRDLMLLSKQIWPLREVVNTLMRDELDWIDESTQIYLRDVYDHAIQLMEILESYRELAGGLADTHLTVVGNRMNEVMKVLTIFATIFIPITFVAGVYGMNFDHIPELHWKASYFVFWMICLSIAGGMLLWFRRRGWL